MLLVTGGWTGFGILDSTEILTEGASQWIYSGPLPSPRRELRAATIGNRLLVTGEILFLLLYLSVPQCKTVMFLLPVFVQVLCFLLQSLEWDFFKIVE